jgi:phage shock protein C
MSEPKKLYRDFQGGWVGGVCAGMAEYFAVDATLVRVLFVLGLILTGIFPLTLVYLVMWAMVPPKPVAPPAAGVPPPVQQS